MLEAFAVQRGASGSAAQQEAPSKHVAAGPDHVANALETENRIEYIEWDCRYAMHRVCSAGSQE